MVISYELKYCFVSTRKCGTNTMYKVLVERYKGQRYGAGFHSNSVHLLPQNETFFIWTIVRNPYTRAISVWASTTQRGHDRYFVRASMEKRGMNPDDFLQFTEFLTIKKRGEVKDDWLGMTQSAWLRGIKLDAVLKIENLVDEFNQLPFVKDKIDRLPYENNTHDVRGDFNQYLTPDAMRFIEGWAMEDFINYKYDFGSI